MDEVSFLAAPHDHLGQAVLRWPFRSRQHGAISNMAGHHRLSVPYDGFTNRGPEPVTANQCRAAKAFAPFGASNHAAAVVIDRHNLPRGGELDELRLLARLVDHVEHV